MGQSRRERTWSTPARTRYAWLREGTHPHDVPRQVFVLAWRRRSYCWFALVVEVVAGEKGPDRVVQRWVSVDVLRPVAADPNQVYGVR